MSRPKLDLPFPTDDSLAELVEKFEACTWPYERWTHRAHLGVGTWYLSRMSHDEALLRIRHHIQLYNRTVGDPTGYHETITRLFLRRIARKLKERNDATSLPQIVDELHRDCDMAWILRYYSSARVWSPEARREWMEPDVRELDF